MRAVLISSILALFLMPVVVQADDELLTLFPKQRAAHQEKIDANQMKYLSRGQEYTDHLYALGGEESMSDPEGFMDEVSIEEGDTVPINVNEVATIIKQDAQQ